MKILITGATGLIGKSLVKHFSDQHELTLVGRTCEKIKSIFFDRYPILTWENLKSLGEAHIKNQDVIINLAGENIGSKRWSFEQKQKILNSRVDATQLIAKICEKLGEHSPRILNASAIGVYGFSQDKIFTEECELQNQTNCFLSIVGSAWENALLSAEKNHVRVVKMRFGVVLSKHGGVLKQMLPAFQWGFGAVLGDGNQLFSWVMLEDLVNAIDFLIHHPDITGPVNIVSPGVISQADFAKSLAHVLHRPCFFRIPARFVRFLFGQMGDELLLHGQCVKSEKLLQSGFQFQHTQIDSALQFLLSRNETTAP